MANSQDVILKFSADTTEVTKGIESVEDGVKGTDSAVGGLTSQLDKMTGGAVTGFRNFAKGVKTGVLGLKTFKVALAATGIGLLLVAFASLASFFTSTKKGAEQLKIATAALGAIFDVLRDRVSKMGEVLFNAISNPQETIKNIGKLIKDNLINRFEGMLELIPAVGKAISLALKGEFSEAGKVAADAAAKMVLGVESITDVVTKAGEAVAGLTEEITKEAQAAGDLQAAMNTLKDEERDFIKQRAETNKLIAEARLLAEDDTLAVEERTKALQKAVDLEQETAARQLELAEERARIVKEQVGLGQSLEEDFQAVAEAEAVVIDLQTASLRTQKRLQTELNSLKVEGITKAHEAMKAEIDLANATVKAMEVRKKAEIKTLQVTQEVTTATLQTRQSSFVSQVLAAETTEEAIRRQRRETFEDFKNGAEAAGHQALKFASMTLDIMGSLNTLFTKDEEKRAKRSFEIGKKLAIVSAIMNTSEGVTAALTDKTQPSTLLRILGGVAVAAAGVAQIATIKRQKFNSGGSPPPAPSGGGGGGSMGAIPQAPQLDLGFLGGGAGQDGFRTYVIASEVSNSQQANQKINDQAALVG